MQLALVHVCSPSFIEYCQTCLRQHKSFPWPKMQHTLVGFLLLASAYAQCPTLAGVDFVPTWNGQNPTLYLVRVNLTCDSPVSAIMNRQYPGTGYFESRVTAALYTDYNNRPT